MRARSIMLFSRSVLPSVVVWSFAGIGIAVGVAAYTGAYFVY